MGVHGQSSDQGLRAEFAGLGWAVSGAELRLVEQLPRPPELTGSEVTKSCRSTKLAFEDSAAATAWSRRSMARILTVWGVAHYGARAASGTRQHLCQDLAFLGAQWRASRGQSPTSVVSAADARDLSNAIADVEWGRAPNFANLTVGVDPKRKRQPISLPIEGLAAASSNSSQELGPASPGTAARGEQSSRLINLADIFGVKIGDSLAFPRCTPVNFVSEKEACAVPTADLVRGAISREPLPTTSGEFAMSWCGSMRPKYATDHPGLGCAYLRGATRSGKIFDLRIGVPFTNEVVEDFQASFGRALPVEVQAADGTRASRYEWHLPERIRIRLTCPVNPNACLADALDERAQ